MPHRVRPLSSALAAAALLLGACDAFLPAAPPEDETLVGPIPGLSGPQRALHLKGDGEFARFFATADGLGPVFVANSCEACHTADGKGHPFINITRFGRDTGGGFDPMTALGGPQLQDRAVAGYVAERLAAAATGVARFLAPAVSGLGFLDAVDDTTLQRLADPNDLDADGISGRLQLLAATAVHAHAIALARDADPLSLQRGTQVGGMQVGRFGKKGLAVNLVQQVAGAYHEDMGITTDLLPVEITNPQAGAAAADPASEPEIPATTLQAVTFYMRTLRTPPRRDSSSADVLAGEQLFAGSLCARCHLPSLTTGASSLPALDRRTFHPFTDLLLHDMGAALDDGYTEGSATTSEWRTAPLWGLGLAASVQGGVPRLLHDGRATSIEAAVGFHGGEAAASRAWFDGLNATQRRQLLAYLNSL